MGLFAFLMFGTAVFVPGPMRWFFIIFGLLALAMSFWPGDKPTELDADVWSADPEERAARLNAKLESWRAGRPYISPEKAARWTSGSADPIVIANPNAERPARRLVRRTPLHPPHWE